MIHVSRSSAWRISHPGGTTRVSSQHLLQLPTPPPPVPVGAITPPGGSKLTSWAAVRSELRQFLAGSTRSALPSRAPGARRWCAPHLGKPFRSDPTHLKRCRAWKDEVGSAGQSQSVERRLRTFLSDVPLPPTPPVSLFSAAYPPYCYVLRTPSPPPFHPRVCPQDSCSCRRHSLRRQAPHLNRLRNLEPTTHLPAPEGFLDPRYVYSFSCPTSS